MKEHEYCEEFYENFHTFWEKFPFPVMLVHKDRTILDCNKSANAFGCVIGTRCVDRGGPEAHKGCLANQALKEGMAKRSVGYIELMNKVLDSYWVPLEGYKDVFLHFSIDITDCAAERFFPET